jgi:hypothetical protein
LIELERHVSALPECDGRGDIGAVLSVLRVYMGLDDPHPPRAIRRLVELGLTV